MPLYEYQCVKCDQRTELIQRISDPPPAGCEKCGTAGEMKKLHSAPAIQFKGSGFYKTDYASGSSSASAAPAGKSDSASTASAGSDTKSSDSAAAGASTSSSDSGKSDTKSAATKSE